jgi:hypothetical protein
MNRGFAIAAFCSLALAACSGPIDRHYRADYAPMMLEKPGQDNAPIFAYTHFLSLEMERTRVKARFERARTHCLQDSAILCKLESASIDLGGDSGENFTDATLAVELPRDQIGPFEQAIQAALPGEDAADIRVASRSTRAQNVTKEQSDVERRIVQLNDYRDRLTALSKRPDVRVDDLIKIESELSSVQSQLEQLTAQARDVGDRVSREQLTISIGERQTLGDAFRPIGRVLHDSVFLIASSAADALRFLIQSIPWLPIVAAAFFLLSWFWRRVRRQKA